MATSMKNVIGTLGTAAANIYSPAAGKVNGIIIGSSFANITGQAQTVTIQIFNAAQALTKTIVNAATVAANGTFTLDPEMPKIFLSAGDQILAFAGAASAIDFSLQIAEQ